MKYLYKKIESNIVLWFQESNKYIVLEPLFYEVFKCYSENNKEFAQSYLVNTLNFSAEAVKDSYKSYKTLISQLSVTKFTINEFDIPDAIDNWYYECNYLVYGVGVKLRFSNPYAKNLIHPKFAHLQKKSKILSNHIIEVIHQSDKLFLKLNNNIVGSWTIEEGHFLQGKFAIVLLNLSCNKNDSDWVAVLHASAVYKNEKAIVFLGESGSGKSTATTLLTMNNYKLLADDFVPLGAEDEQVYSFPAAISIKERALEYMEANFPQLRDADLRCKGKDIQYKYLYPEHNTESYISLPTKALVFVNYKQGALTSLEELTSCKALEYLIPDSWISPQEIHVSSFLRWIEKVPAYRLEYSNNQEFLDVIDRL